MKLTRVTAENIAYCVQLANELVDASAFEVPFDWNFAYASGRATLDDPTYYSCMAVIDDTHVGMVLGRVSTFYFNPTLFGIEDAWFVRPNTRGRTRVAMALMRSFVAWCGQQGAIHVMTSDTASIEPLNVDRLYRHLGFERYGAVYRYRIGESNAVDTGRST